MKYSAMYLFALPFSLALAAGIKAQIQKPLVSGDGDECHNAVRTTSFHASVDHPDNI